MRGRFRVGPGDVLLHGAFEAHLDRFAHDGAQILNLIGTDIVPAFSMGRIADADALVRTAEHAPWEAIRQMQQQIQAVQPGPEDWPARLARDLMRDPDCGIGAWAREHGFAAETVSRGFRKVFGVTPERFRAEARAHRAFRLIVGEDAPLASIAAAAGFADQAHMSRAVRAVTGAPPGAWRKSNAFNTAIMRSD